MKTVVVAGATGAVGIEAARLVAARPELRGIALARRDAPLPPGIAPRRFAYDDPAAYDALFAEVPADVLLIALGTTIAKAGSAEAFNRVDRDYPLALIEALRRARPDAVVGLVSAAGTAGGGNLYYRAKAAVEAGLGASGLRHAILRPSLLIAERAELRPGERLALALLAPPYLAFARHLAPRSRAVWRYAPVAAGRVAAALLHHTLDDPPPAAGRIVEGLELHAAPAPVGRRAA
ncbi:MAG TPA: NAD-dependent epimerase/dehydratase family protein [Alphaproteobacteria bacterium]|nr:NAD-dependent epimerase/dehydratase family protein [Alphaproteobacteria bacterium]